MNYFQQLTFLLISSVLAQNYNDQTNNNAPMQYTDNQQQQQFNNNQANYPMNNQDQKQQFQDNRAQVQQQVSSVRQNYGPTGTVMDNISSQRQERMQSLSSYAMANGFTSLQPDQRQAFISSLVTANSAKANERKESASAFMATQTQIPSASLAQAVSSIKATASGKPKRKALFAKKEKKASVVQNVAVNGSIVATPSATSKSSGFQNFFKSIQGKIQKSSSVASVSDSTAAAATAVANI